VAACSDAGDALASETARGQQAELKPTVRGGGGSPKGASSPGKARTAAAGAAANGTTLSIRSSVVLKRALTRADPMGLLSIAASSAGGRRH
jgi:hypothetical protein